MADPASPTAAALATGAAVSGTATAITVLQDAAVALLGVPLPVVLGGLTGALAARVFLPPAPFWAALGGSTLWTAIASFLAQLVQWLLGTAGRWAAGADAPVPAGALAGIALVVAALGPHALPVLVDRGPAALRRVLDAIKGGSGNGNG